MGQAMVDTQKLHDEVDALAPNLTRLPSFLVKVVLLFLLPLQLFAGPALPPLVPEGENLADFPNWVIDERTIYNTIAFSSDGKILASDSLDNTIRLWDTQAKRLLHTFVGHKNWVKSVSFSSDGKTLASGAVDNTIKLWDTQTKRLLHTFEGHNDAVRSVSFSPDGKTLASGSDDNTLKLWSTQTKRLLHTFEGHENSVISVSFSPDGRTLASGSDDNTLKLWDTQTRRPLYTLEGHNSLVYSVSFSPDGKILASGSDDNTLKLWDTQTRRLVYTFEEHNSPVRSVSFSPDGKTLASGSDDNTLKLWDTQTRRLLHTFEGHNSSVYSVSFSPEGQILASGSYDSTLKLWDTQTKRLLHTFEGHNSLVNSVSFSPDGKTLASGSYDNTLKLWGTQTKRLLHTFEGHNSLVNSVSFSPDGKILASGSEDNTLKLWDTQTRHLLHTFEGHNSSVNSVSFSPDGKILASGSEDNTLKLWNTQTKRLLHTFEGHNSLINSVSFSPDGKTLASGSYDNTLKLWNTQTRRLLHTFEGHNSLVNSVSFSPDGKTLASGSYDNTIKLWDTQTRRLLYTFEGHNSLVRSVRFSPDGKTLASGSDDNTLKLWDTQTRHPLYTLEGHNSSVRSVSFSPDGKTLASGSDNNTIKLWDTNTKKLLHTMIGGVNGNWLSHNGKTFQRGDDGSLLLVPGEEGLQSALPKTFNKSKVKPPTLSLSTNTPIILFSGKTHDISFEVTNTGQQTLYWPDIELAAGRPFSQHTFFGDAPNLIEPGKTVRVHARIGAHLKEPFAPETRTLKLRLVAPQQTASDWLEIPVRVEMPQLAISTAEFLQDENIIKIRIDNKGTQATENTFYATLDLNTPDLPEPYSPVVPIPGTIEPGSFAEVPFSIPPESFTPKKGHKIKLDVRNASLPFMQWDFTPTLTLQKPPLWMYASLALLAMLSAVGIFYLRRYRHPLVVSLSDNPGSLLHLPPEQLPEARQRLQQTKRLETVLSDASVSPKILQKALAFSGLPKTEKAEYIRQRIGGTLENTFTLKTPEGFPLNIEKLLLCFPETEAPEDIFQNLRTDPANQNKITLIIGPDSDYQRRLYNTTKQLDNKWVAPQGNELTRLLLSPNPENVLAEILSGQLSLQQISPYRVGGGVSNESVFFGRRELIAQITNRDPANYLMVGGRQVGKSTLLKALERRYANNPHIQCHYLALSNEVLIPRLAALLKLDKTRDPEMLAAQLDERIQRDGQRYIFLIDEADRFIEHEKAQDYPILNVFRRLSEEGNCVFILTGFWQLYQHAVLDYQSPIRNFGELLSVGALEQPACIELATEPMRTMNLHWDNPVLVEQLVEQCGQRANLIAIACQHIVRNLPPQQRNITAGDMHKALHSDEIRRALSGWVVGTSEDEQAYERIVVYATIEKQDFSTADLLEMAQRKNLQPDTQQLEKTLSRLELAFILGRDKGRWFYRVPLFAEYIKEDAPAAKLAAELDRLKR